MKSTNFKHSLLILSLWIWFHPVVNAQTQQDSAIMYTDLINLEPNDTLFLFFEGDFYEIGVPCGYMNQKGDTVIPIGKYDYCYFDTFYTFAIVGDSSGLYAIDQNENRLYEVHIFENGPDFLMDGVFRIKRYGKIGFANAKGEIIIQPQYACATQFENGTARVTYSCKLTQIGEYKVMRSDTWFTIDQRGNKLD